MNRAAMVSNMTMAPQFDQPGAVNAVGARARPAIWPRRWAICRSWAARRPPTTPSTRRKTSRSAAAKRPSSRCSRGRSRTRTSTAGRRRRMEHSLVLHNQTDTAWTTGPCLALSADRPLSEDLLKYTPKGGRGELPVTAAINVAHEKSEREDRPQAEGLFARQQPGLLRPGHAGRQAATPQLRETHRRNRRSPTRFPASRSTAVVGRKHLRRSHEAPIAGTERVGPLDGEAGAGRREDAHVPVRAVRAVAIMYGHAFARNGMIECDPNSKGDTPCG